MKHSISVSERVITITEDRKIVRDGVNVDTLTTTLDSEWSSMDMKYLCFENGDTVIEIPFTDEAVIPWEVLQTRGYLYVAVVGYVGNEKRLVTQRMDVPFVVELSGTFVGDGGQEPTPDAVQALIAVSEEAKAVAQSVRDDADAGAFKGDPGDKGDTGDAATIEAGAVTTLAPDQPATVSNSGTKNKAVFDFGIPKGDKGDPGYTPKRGTDYWTDDDIETIKGYVDEAILGGVW